MWQFLACDSQFQCLFFRPFSSHGRRPAGRPCFASKLCLSLKICLTPQTMKLWVTFERGQAVSVQAELTKKSNARVPQRIPRNDRLFTERFVAEPSAWCGETKRHQTITNHYTELQMMH